MRCCYGTGAVYYYWSPVNNNWLRVDVAALAGAQQLTYFPVAGSAPQTPFYTDVAGAPV